MKQFYLLLKLFLLLSIPTWAQVLDPNDPVVEYNASAPPTEPAWGQIGKWVRTTRVSWNSTSYKAYIYKGMQFRLKWPKNYDPSKKYPMVIFFHGLGEKGTKFDNEYQLYHGGQTFMNKVDAGNFDGFLFYPQNLSGYFGPSYYDNIEELINNFFRPQLNVDPYDIIVNGLSAGGSASWDFIRTKTKLVAGATPISAATSDLPNTMNLWKYTPIWHFQGGADGNPTPNVAQGIAVTAQAQGANYKLTVYAGQGHGVWDLAWGEADYFPFITRAYKSNPWPAGGKAEFCANEAVNTVLGLTPGFNQYEWRKNGNLISGATSNTLTVTDYGTYDARIYNGNTWSDWSRIPVVIKVKAPTVSPNITVSGLMSNVLPTPAGSDSVVLEVPAGYTSYQWKKADGTLLGTTNKITVRATGDYLVKVTEQFGCTSDYSAPFKVVAANGANGPDAISGLLATATGRTTIVLNWTDKPNPTYNETAFEIYRSTQQASGYQLIAKAAANAVTYTDINLNPNTAYYYIIRPVNGNGAATPGAAVTATTFADVTAPSTPVLSVTGSSQNSVSLKWTASTDDVAVDKYEIYINGSKSFTINGDQTSFLAAGLVANQTYGFQVKAKDAAGNLSGASNQVNAATVQTGLNYKFYTGSWSNLPNFGTLTPVKTGITPGVDITVRTQDDNFAFLWEGYINIPVAGNYTFETNSDDGSRMWIGSLNGTTSPYTFSGTPFINNDGAHGTTLVGATKTLQKGVYPIAIAFFEAGGGEVMELYWKNTANGVGSTHQLVPASFFSQNPPSDGVKPDAPDSIRVQALSHTKLKIEWNDNSTNESGFEIYRSGTLNGTYALVGSVGANVKAYTDSALTPQTTFYYKVQAINRYGASGYALTETDGLKYDYYEAASSYSALPNFPALTPKKSGNIATVDITPRDRNTQFAFKYEGWIYIPTAGNWTFYTSSDAGSKLYIGTFDAAGQVVSNDHTSGTVEKSGVKNLAAGYYRFFVTYYESTNTRALTASYSGPGLTKRAIPATAFVNPYIKGTTLATPVAPAAPSALTANAASTTTVALKWNDNSTAEAAYEVYRSTAVNTSYLLLKTLPANDSSKVVYTDSTVQANTVYFYKVRGKNEGGNSAYSNEVSVTTGNTVPVLDSLGDKYMRFGTQIIVDIAASDADGDAITLSTTNLPAFASFADNGNGTGTITFNPALADAGNYANITVKAADGKGGIATRTFGLTVDDNFQPVLNAISNVALAEKTTSTINLVAADQNATDVLTWTVTGLPDFATLTPNGNTATIALAPGYAANGTYAVTVKVTDGRGGEDIKTFNITVSDVNPNYQVKINFNEGTWNASPNWNNLNKKPALNDVFSGMLDTQNRNTGMTLTVLTPWQDVNFGNNTNTFGFYPGSNAGIYPDNVMMSNWFTQTVKQTIKYSGLDTNYTYKFTFFGSRNGISDARMSIFRLNDTASVQLNATNNQSTTVSVSARPNAAGEIKFDLDVLPGAPAASQYAYMASVVIDASYEDGSAPAKAGALAATVNQSGVKLSWTDRAYNESGYQILRSNTANGAFNVIGNTAVNDSTFTDPNVVGSTTYYYYVATLGLTGTTSSDTIAVTLPNRAPSLAAIADVNMKTDAVVVINLSATDDPADVITFSATNLPTFATLNNTGNGTGTITLSPVAGNTGVFNFTVLATDNNGLQSSRAVKVSVADKTLTSTYVNFNRTFPVAAPWNNFNSLPNANVSVANLLDGSGVNTGYTITILDAMTGDNEFGAVTGNNSGVYPDDVMRTAFYDQTNTDKRVRISGLSSTLKYNLVFFGSRGQVSDNRNTTYTVGAQSVTLNAAGNTANTVQLNGLTADASGNITFVMRQAAGSSYAYLNAMVIQSYVDNGVPIAPDNLATSGATSNSIKLTWADKSSTETGFEIYRSTSRTGTYSLVTTTAANATSYTNTGLAANTVYFYKIRAKASAAIFSSYTAVVAGSTMAYSVSFNFNVEQPPAPAPWNNANSLPYQGQTFANPKDNNGNPTSFTMQITDNFTGTNNAGATTGNNSGVYPDVVMAESYYVEAGDTAKMTFTGLDMSKEYSFTFFGSRKSSGLRYAIYEVSGRTVKLDVYDNTSNTVTLDHLIPNENGELVLRVYAETVYGYLSSLVVTAYPKEAVGGTQMARTGGNSDVLVVSDLAKDDHTLKTTEEITIQKAWPNPFSTDIYLNMLIGQKGGKVEVRLTDLNGHQILGKNLGNLSAGTYQQTLNVGGNIPVGVYILQVMIDGKAAKSVKLIRN